MNEAFNNQKQRAIEELLKMESEDDEDDKKEDQAVDKQNCLDEFKKEFADDIDSVDISVEKLKKLKISLSVLEAETLLRKVFGDEIYAPKKKEEKVTGEKEIVKLSEDDMSFDGEVRDICENLEDLDFEGKVAMYILKLDTGE